MDRRRILKSLAAASGTAIVSACGGGSVGSGQPVLLPGPTPTPAPTPVPTPTPTPTPAASFDSYGTRFASGVTDSAGRAKIWPHIYIDPFNGVDGRGGSTLATALRTCAGLIAHPLLGAAGTRGNPTFISGLTIGIVGHPTAFIRDQFDFYLENATNGFRQLHRCSFVRVGTAPVRFEGTDPASAGDWSAHPSIAGAYRIGWVPQTNGDTVSRLRVFAPDPVNRRLGRPLKRVEREAELSAGTYWYDGTPAFGVAKIVAIKLFDGSDPRTNGQTIEITRRDVGIAMRSGVIQGIWGYRHGHNNGSLYAFDGLRADGTRGAPTQFRGCLVYEGTKHNMVVGAGEHIDLIAVNSIDNEYLDPFTFPAYMTAFESDIGGKTVTMTRCTAIADTTLWQDENVAVGQYQATAFVTHDGNPNGGPAQLTCTDCSSIRLGAAWSLGHSRSVDVTAYYCPGTTAVSKFDGNQMSADGGFPVRISRSFFGPGSLQWFNGGNVTVASSIFFSNKTFSGGGIANIDAAVSNQTVSDSIFIAEATQNALFLYSNGTGSINVQRNIFVGAVAWGISTYTAVPTSEPSAVSDANIFKSSGGPEFYSAYKGVFRTLPEWKAASGQDGRTTKVSDATEAGFVSGAFPRSDNTDVRLTTSGPGSRLVNPIQQSEIDAMRARPSTLAKAEAAILVAPSLLPIFEGA